MPKVPEVSKSAKKSQEKEVVYDSVKTLIAMGEKAISAGQAKKLLGWAPETEKQKFGNDFDLLDAHKVKVRCLNNVSNRPLYMGIVDTLIQEILRKRWVFNGESIIIGDRGSILNGQHTLIATVLAAQVWADDKEKWGQYWQEEPSIDKLIVFGVEERDEVVNTMDTCKPRSLADVIYRCPFFSNLSKKDRKNASRTTDYGIRMLWHRTGAGLDAFAPHRTHSESVDFLTRHPKLLEAVKHIVTENGTENRLGRYCSLGYAAGLLYLMGSSSTDSKEYMESSNPNENSLNWDNWDKACDYWVHLASGSKETAAIRNVLKEMLEEGKGTNAVRWAVLAKGWLCFVEGDKIEADDLALNFVADDDGFARLAEFPSVGGIDLGDPKEVDEEKLAKNDPKEEDIKKKGKELKQKALYGKTASTGVPIKGTRKGEKWAKGDKAWVYDSDGDHYFGTLDEPYLCDDKVWRVNVDTGDKTWETTLKSLSLEKPGAVEKAEMPKMGDKKKEKKAKKGFEVGSAWWVVQEGKEPYKAKIVELSNKAAKVKILQGFQGTGNIEVVHFTELQKSPPA